MATLALKWEKNTTLAFNNIYIYQFFFLFFIFSWHKCIFSPYILTFFHFGPYILILPLLVPKPINACYFRPFRQSTDGNS